MKPFSNLGNPSIIYGQVGQKTSNSCRVSLPNLGGFLILLSDGQERKENGRLFEYGPQLAVKQKTGFSYAVLINGQS